jgi:adenylate cyclase class IV
MPANIEIKAKVGDPSALRIRVETLCDGAGPKEVLHQRDTFFNVAIGRLKLRDFGDGRGELILYDRPDAPGPRTSRYLIAATSDPAALGTILGSVLGAAGMVQKQRTLYRVGQTRIHLDEVDGLGHYVELEVVLRPGQPEAEGVKIADDWMDALGISRDQLVECAYVDLLSKNERE